MSRPTAIDLFCGVGGLSLGLEQAGFDVVAAVDCDRINCQTHKLNFPDCPTVCHDITKLTAASLRQIAGIGSRPIDLVAGGPPCQSFSLIGKRQLDDERSELIFEFARLAIELDTSYFIMENVPGLLSSKHRWYLDEVIKQFRNAGYVVHEPVILNAAHYGVPQNRKRLFLMGCKRGFDLPIYPPPDTKTGPTVWDALADLPEVSDYPELLTSDWIETDWFTKEGTYAASLRSRSVPLGVWDNARTFNPNLLTNSKRCQHSPESIARFAKTPPGKIEPISRFHKLNPYGLAPTLRAGTGNDRGNHTAPRPIHPHQPRCITVREGARLHSFPDWFRFHPTILCGFRQLGNSVPPLLAKSIASSIIDVIG